MDSKINYLLDTNILLDGLDEFLSTVSNAGVIIPAVVLEELDKQKTREGELGFKARKAVRCLFEINKYGSLNNWIVLKDHVSLKIEHNFDEDLKIKYDKNDDIILGSLSYCNKTYGKTIMISNDILVCIKAEALGFEKKTFNFKNDYISDMYKGYLSVYLEDSKVDKFYKDGFLKVDSCLIGRSPYPNEFIIGISESNEKRKILGKYNLKNKRFEKLKYSESMFYGFKAKDINQRFALELLFDDDVKVVTLSARQGCGKTFMALGAALEQVLEKDKFNQLLIGKSTVPIDKWSYQGYTSGTTNEKLLTHFNNYLTTLENLHSNRDKNTDGLKLFTGLEALNKIKILDISSILGSSFDNKILIVDEAESFNSSVCRSILTRISDNCKIILLGDLRQQSLTNYHKNESGLYAAIEWLKEVDGVGHVTLEKVHRGMIVDEISKKFDENLYGAY